MDIGVFKALAIALGLGLLVGLQREKAAAARIAGVRTFPMITVLGCVSALLAQQFGGWILAAAALSLAGLVIASDITSARDGHADHGTTTEIAMLLMFAVGAYLIIGRTEVAVVIGGGVAVLLQYKGQLHGIATKLGDDDLKAIMQFALVSLVILPVLPNQAYGPYSVLNPRQIWVMVVLIVGINLGGYIVYKFFGENAGTVSGGILGGLISSTATAVSYARRTREQPEATGLAAVVVMISSTVVFVRVLLEIGIVARDFLLVSLIPMLLMLVLFAILSMGVWYWRKREQPQIAEHQNPSELKPALLFGLLYAAALFAVAAAKAHFGTKALYLVAGASGLTQVDAVTLSTSQLVSAGRLESQSGWRLILLAALANLAFKAAAIAFLGSRRLFVEIALLFAVATLGGIGLIVFWPQ